MIDPIIAGTFHYVPVGVNLTGTPNTVQGSFYVAAFPAVSGSSNNSTGGKLLEPYAGFLTFGSQFENQPLFAGRQLVTFSRYTSFCVISFATAQRPPGPPQTGYQTAIFEDPNPVLAMASIIETSVDTMKSVLVFSYYSQSYQIPNFSNPMNVIIGRDPFVNTDAWMWNPAAIRMFGPVGFPDVAFVSNPIVSPWINTVKSSPQVSMTHSLIYADGSYHIGLNFAGLGPDVLPSNVGLTGIFIPAIITSGSGVANRLSSRELLITSWDAITTYAIGSAVINTTVVMYGLSQITGQYIMYSLQMQLTESGGFLNPAVSVPGNPDWVPVLPVTLDLKVVSRNTQCRLSRMNQESVEPLLAVSFFYEVVSGLQITTSAINSSGDSFALTTCTADDIRPGVSALIYVTPVTGAYNYGSFVVWCETAEARSAFLVIQVNPLCRASILTPGVIYSAVYWRRLNIDPDDYFIYPIGGASLPFFLATDKRLTFDGSPALQPIVV